MYCPKCGANVADDNKFCGKCGCDIFEEIKNIQSKQEAGAPEVKTAAGELPKQVDEASARDDTADKYAPNNRTESDMQKEPAAPYPGYTYKMYPPKSEAPAYQQKDEYGQPQAQHVYQQPQTIPANNDDATLKTVIKVFLIIGCVVGGICGFLIPLAWCIPMTVHTFRKLNTGQPVSLAMKICTLLFVSIVSGVCLLCLKED